MAANESAPAAAAPLYPQSVQEEAVFVNSQKPLPAQLSAPVASSAVVPPAPFKAVVPSTPPVVAAPVHPNVVVPAQVIVPAQLTEPLLPKVADQQSVADALKNYQVLLEPPSPDRLFGSSLDSEKMLESRMRQQALQRNPPEDVKFPYNPPLSREKYQARAFPPALEIAEPSFVCYNRLYFEDKNSERYGWDLGFIQPFVSSAIFAKDVVFWPYHAGLRPLERSDTSAGQCLPGDPVPYLIYPPDVSASGGILEGAVVLGLFAIFP